MVSNHVQQSDASGKWLSKSVRYLAWYIIHGTLATKGLREWHDGLRQHRSIVTPLSLGRHDRKVQVRGKSLCPGEQSPMNWRQWHWAHGLILPPASKTLLYPLSQRSYPSPPHMKISLSHSSLYPRIAPSLSSLVKPNFLKELSLLTTFTSSLPVLFKFLWNRDSSG